MAFVNELIPEAEKEKFTFPVYTARSGSKPTLWKWTIDRERNIYLVHIKNVGGSYEGTQETNHYILNWQGSFISFAGESVVSNSAETGRIISWHVHHIVIPVALIGQQDEVLALIREALDAMGWLYDRNRVVAVNVNFDISVSY